MTSIPSMNKFRLKVSKILGYQVLYMRIVHIKKTSYRQTTLPALE